MPIVASKKAITERYCLAKGKAVYIVGVSKHCLLITLTFLKMALLNFIKRIESSEPLVVVPKYKAYFSKCFKLG